MTEAADETQEPIRQTAPIFPWEITLNAFGMFVQKMPDGGLILKLAPTQMTQQGQMAMAPAVALRFDASSWAAFKDFVASDGEQVKPRIVTAKVMPGR